MIERHAEFIHELNNICEDIVKHGELNHDEEKMKTSFLNQVCGSPENIACIENIEYDTVMKYVPFNGKRRKNFGLKIKDTDVLLTDIAYLLENDEVTNIISKTYPELSTEKIEAAQRAITLILTAFECVELGKYYENDDI